VGCLAKICQANVTDPVPFDLASMQPTIDESSFKDMPSIFKPDLKRKMLFANVRFLFLCEKQVGAGNVAHDCPKDNSPLLAPLRSQALMRAAGEHTCVLAGVNVLPYECEYMCTIISYAYKLPCAPMRVCACLQALMHTCACERACSSGCACSLSASIMLI
jgi:hypothetical protein